MKLQKQIILVQITFEQMKLEMKPFLKILMLSITLALTAGQASAQTAYQLHIDSVAGLPDTIVDGQELTFYVIVSMESPLFYQGNLFIELEYNGAFHAVDSTVSANAFLGPNAPNTVQATHRFSSADDLSIGDNVVVVWPRIGDGTNPPQEVPDPFHTVITLIEPSGISDEPRNKEPLFHPNPASHTIQIISVIDTDEMTTTLYDTFGRLVLRSTEKSLIDVSKLPVGVYLVQVSTSNGTVRSQRLLISR